MGLLRKLVLTLRRRLSVLARQARGLPPRSGQRASRRSSYSVRQADTEAAVPRSNKRLAKEATHGMNWMGSFYGDRGYDQVGLPPQDPHLHFFDTKVRPILEKAGDADCVPVQGNLYSYMAMRPFGDTGPPGSYPLFQDKANWVVLTGLYITMIVQIVAPPCVLYFAMVRCAIFDPRDSVLGVSEAAQGLGIGLSQTMRFDPNSYEYGPTFILTRVLGVLFIILFLLNGLFVLQSDKDDAIKVMSLCKIFQTVGERDSNYESPREMWLWWGALINSWCLIICSLCMPFLFVIGDQGVKDVVFDSLGLTFLYNLDDISGDLGFLTDKWDEGQLGDMYGALADNVELLTDIDEEREQDWTPDNVYAAGRVIVYILLVVLPLLLIFGEMHPRDTNAGAGRRLGASVGQVTALEQHVQALESQLQQLRAATGL